MTEHQTESSHIERCPKCGSRTPIGHRCIVDDLDAIRNADLSDHPLTQAIKNVAPQTENTHHHEWRKVTRIVQGCLCGAEREWDGFEWWMTRKVTTPSGDRA